MYFVPFTFFLSFSISSLVRHSQLRKKVVSFLLNLLQNDTLIEEEEEEDEEEEEGEEEEEEGEEEEEEEEEGNREVNHRIVMAESDIPQSSNQSPPPPPPGALHRTRSDMTFVKSNMAVTSTSGPSSSPTSNLPPSLSPSRVSLPTVSTTSILSQVMNVSLHNASVFIMQQSSNSLSFNCTACMANLSVEFLQSMMQQSGSF